MDRLYAADAEFRDPINAANGRSEVIAVFRDLFKQLEGVAYDDTRGLFSGGVGMSRVDDGLSVSRETAGALTASAVFSFEATARSRGRLIIGTRPSAFTESFP